MQKKYLLFTNSLNEGGAEKVISLLSNYLGSNNDVILIKINPRSSVYNIDSKVDVISLWKGNYKSFYRFILFPVFVLKLYRIIKSQKPNFVISFLPIPNFINISTTFFIPKRKHKIVINERCYPSIAYNSSKLRFYFYKMLIPVFYNKTDFLFANTERIILDLKENFNVNKKGFIFHNPIGFPKQELPKEYNDNFPKKIVMVGRLSKEKGYDVALKVIKVLNRKGDYQLHIYGKGSLHQNLKEQIRKLKLTQYVFLHGHDKKVQNKLRMYDFYMLTSKTEGFPNALIEAMNSGLPVVSTNCLTGPLEIINCGERELQRHNGFYRGKYGLLSEVNDINGLVNAIIYLNNQETYHTFSKLSLKRAESFETNSVLERFIKTID